jgi:WD40 repeat protein
MSKHNKSKLEEIENERNSHGHTILELEEERRNVEITRTTMSKLLQELGEYKSVIGGYREEIELELEDKLMELERLKDTNLELLTQIEETEKRNRNLFEEIEKKETFYEKEISRELLIKSDLKKETMENLQTILDELTRIEESNEELRRSHSQRMEKLKHEKEEHTKLLELLVKKQGEYNNSKLEVENLKLKNEELVSDLKHAKKSSMRTGVPSYRTRTGTVSDGSASSPHGSLLEGIGRSMEECCFSLASKLHPPHNGAVICCLIIENQLWVGCGDGLVRIWNTESMQLIEDRRGVHSGSINCMVAVRGEQVWTTAVDRSLVIWSIKKLSPLKKITFALSSNSTSGLNNSSNNINISNNGSGSENLSGSNNNNSTNNHNNTNNNNTNNNNNNPKSFLIRFLVEVDQFVWAGCTDGKIRLWESKSLKCKKELRVEADPKAEVALASITTCALRRGNQVWVGTETGTLLVWNTTQLKLTHTLVEPHTARINAIASTSQQQVWVSGADKKLSCWNCENVTLYQTIPLFAEVSTLLSVVRPTQSYVCSGNEDGDIFLWNPLSFEMIAELPRVHKETVSVLLLDNKSRLWSTSWDKQIAVWKPQ